jgi:hypothetical protein
VAAVVIAALAVAYVVTRDDDEPTAAPKPEQSSSSAASSSATTPAAGDTAKAVASMADAFAGQLGITADDATCVARTTIEAVGLQHLVDIGMFDTAMEFHDLDLGPFPEVKSALTSATVSCAAA